VGLVPGGRGVALGAVEEEALANIRWVKTYRHDNKTHGERDCTYLGP
jgi:hypothetical protein